MDENLSEAGRSRRDPLSLGFEAHRGLLLLKLRLHASADRRKATTGKSYALSVAAARRRLSTRAASTTSSDPNISNPQSGAAR